MPDVKRWPTSTSAFVLVDEHTDHNGNRVVLIQGMSGKYGIGIDHRSVGGEPRVWFPSIDVLTRFVDNADDPQGEHDGFACDDIEAGDYVWSDGAWRLVLAANEDEFDGELHLKLDDPCDYTGTYAVRRASAPSSEVGGDVSASPSSKNSPSQSSSSVGVGTEKKS